MTLIIKILLGFYFIFSLFVMDILYMVSEKKRPLIILMLALTVAVIALNLHFNARVFEFYIPVLFLLCLNNFIVFRSNRISGVNQKRYLFIRFMLIFPVIAMILQLFYMEIYSLNFYASLLFNAFIIFLLFLTIKNNSMHIKQNTILSIISYFAFFNAFFGIIQVIFNKRFLPGKLGEDVLEAGLRRAYGFGGGVNGAGNLGAILFIITLYILIKRRSAWNTAVFILNFIFLVFTFTRIAYLGAGFGLLVIFFFQGKNRRRGLDLINLFKKGLIVIICAIILYFSFQTFVFDLYDYIFSARGATHQHRIDQFQDVWIFIRESPLTGVGAGQYSYVLGKRFDKIDLSIHSQWLSILTEEGAIALAVFIMLDLTLFLILFRKYRDYGWYMAALFMTKTVVSNFNANQYYFVVNNIFYFTVFGLIFSKEGDGSLDVKEKKG